ncbi:MAG: hypothetical protein P1V97_02880 [Planctomycetota bacterium]|nr:hypothetical protein [Planctomycetota bacterium]
MSGPQLPAQTAYSSPPSARAGTGYERLLEDLAAWIEVEKCFPLITRVQDQLIGDVNAIKQ